MMKPATKPDDLETCWSFFDRCFCISLEARTDRRKSAAAQFKRVGLVNRIEFVIVTPHPDHCEAGIFASHIACLRKGLNAGARSILVFEDDILFDRFAPETLLDGIRFLQQTPDWNAYYLGGLVKKSEKTHNPSVARVWFRSLSHAYAFNRPFAKRIVADNQNHIPYDAMLGLYPDHCYMARPAFAFQDDSPSDNHNHRILNQTRLVFGGLRRIQKMNEWYHCHKKGLYVLHAAVITALFFLCMIVWMARP